MSLHYSYHQQPSIVNVQHPIPTTTTSTTTNIIGGDDNSSTLAANTEMEIELEAMWAKVNLEIQRLDPYKKDHWKVQSLPLARIKKIMKIEEFVLQELEKEQQKQQLLQQQNRHQGELGGFPITDNSTDGRTDASINNDTRTPPLEVNENATGMDGTDYNSGSNGFDNSVDNNNHNDSYNSKISNGFNSDTGIKFMISSEAPVLVTKACEIFIQEISTRAWKHTDRNRRRTLQRSDVFAALSECETFDFLIDFIPRSNAPTISATPTIMVNAPSVSTIPQNNESSQLSTPSTVPLSTTAAPQQLLQAPFINNSQFLIAAPAPMILPPNPFAHQTHQYVPTSSANNLYSSTNTNSATLGTPSIMPPLVLAPPPTLNGNATPANDDNDTKHETDNNSSTITNISYLQHQPMLEQRTTATSTTTAPSLVANPMLFFQPQYNAATIPTPVVPLTGHFQHLEHVLTAASHEATSSTVTANKINNDSSELAPSTAGTSHDQQQQPQTQQQQEWA